MIDLNLPEFKAPLPKKKVLSMDEYLEFVMFNLRNNFDREAYLRWKKMTAVNVPFVMKD